MNTKLVLHKMIKVDENSKFNIKESITKLNYYILKFCIAAMYNTDEIETCIYDTCEQFANCMYNTYSNNQEQCAEILSNLYKDSTNVLKTFDKKTPQESLRLVAYEIGIISESETNYTVADRMILVIAVARKLGFKFDFSWKM